MVRSGTRILFPEALHTVAGFSQDQTGDNNGKPGIPHGDRIEWLHWSILIGWIDSRFHHEDPRRGSRLSFRW